MQFPVLPLAARTAAVTGTEINLDSSRFLHVITNVTAYTSGSLTPTIQGKDAFGNWYDLLVGTALAATGINVLKIGPGFTGSANAVATDIVPDAIRINFAVGSAASITYSCAINTKA